MRHLLACLAILAAFAAGAQSMPYNPDANDDGYIGAPDLLSLLPLFGSQVGIDSSFTCDYDGTEFESLIVGLITEEYVLDSVYLEYVIRDTLTYFTPGCPDEIVEPIVLERSCSMSDIAHGNLNNSFGDEGYEVVAQTFLFGFERTLKLQYYESSNTFVLWLVDYEVAELPNHNGEALWDDISTSSQTAHVPLPFPSHWLIDEDGFQIDWRVTSWINACEYFRVIPYWHYAE